MAESVFSFGETNKKIEELSAHLVTLQSQRIWTLLVNDFNPTEGMAKTTPSMANMTELLILLVANGEVRQSYNVPLQLVPSSGTRCFPDFMFASSRLYFGLTKPSDTSLKFTNLGASGNNNWTNTALTIYGR